MSLGLRNGTFFASSGVVIARPSEARALRNGTFFADSLGRQCVFIMESPLRVDSDDKFAERIAKNKKKVVLLVAQTVLGSSYLHQ